MSQSKVMSAVESVTNIGVGMLVALATQMAIFPLFGLQVTFGENLAILAIFTAVSFIRSYLLRRVFDRQVKPVAYHSECYYTGGHGCNNRRLVVGTEKVNIKV